MLAAIMLALALTFVAPGVAGAQMNPAQAASLATSIAGVVFGTLYPAPRCGPHDAPPPRPYQPVAPQYAPPPGPPQHANLDDDDDDDDEPVRPRFHRHLSTAASQPQTRPDAEDESGQTTDVRARDDSRQPADEAAMDDDDGQPMQAPVAHRSARPAQTIGQTQSSGQVAEIPSQPRIAQPLPPGQ